MYIIGVVIPVIGIFGAVVWGLLSEKRLLTKIITTGIVILIMTRIIIWNI